MQGWSKNLGLRAKQRNLQGVAVRVMMVMLTRKMTKIMMPRYRENTKIPQQQENKEPAKVFCRR